METDPLILVKPLPKEVLREAYSTQDFMDGISGEQLANSQIQNEPE